MQKNYSKLKMMVILENQKIREKQEKVFKTPLHLIILSSQDLQDLEDDLINNIYDLFSESLISS